VQILPSAIPYLPSAVGNASDFRRYAWKLDEEVFLFLSSRFDPKLRLRKQLAKVVFDYAPPQYLLSP
jgi:hypothetical protein